LTAGLVGCDDLTSLFNAQLILAFCAARVTGVTKKERKILNAKQYRLMKLETILFPLKTVNASPRLAILKCSIHCFIKPIPKKT
jgi:hypothetical protein